MKRTLLLLLPLAVACSQPEPEERAINKMIDIANEQVEIEASEYMEIKKENWAINKGDYQVVYDIQDGGAIEYYRLNDDGTCTWTYDGFSKSGDYTVNHKTNELRILIMGNAGVIEERYSFTDKGQWCKANGCLQKIK
jgi:hypothetical protein